LDQATLKYTLICDDVRLEMGNKMSLMGLFQNVFLPQFPATVVKFAILNHWIGQGTFESEIRIMDPNGNEAVRSRPAKFSVTAGGHADNITFFSNVTFKSAGTYTIQIVLAENVVEEKPIHIRLAERAPGSGSVN
jgi:hypothetical protein